MSAGLPLIGVLIGLATVCAIGALLAVAWWCDLGQARLDAAQDSHAGSAPRPVRGEDF